MEQALIRPGRGGAVVGLPLGEIFTVASEYEHAGRLDDAERLVGHILAAYPSQPDALHLGGIIAFRRKRYDESLGRLQGAIQHGVDTPLYLRNICEVYRVLGRMDEALATARRAVAMAPADPHCLHNLAVVHYHRLEPDACLGAARQALALDPMLPAAHFAAAEALLLKGEMEQGWEEYEWRFRIGGIQTPIPATDKPQWNGEALPSGTLLLVADQGFGDAIQFMRYIPWVAARCPNLAIAASAELAPLLRQMAPNAPIFQRWDHCPAFSAYITLSGLPRLHGTRLENVPWTGAYLYSKPDRRAAWADRLATLLPAGYTRVGVAWAGRPTHNNDRNRSVSLQALRALGNVPRVALVSIQKGATAKQAGDWFGRAPLVGLGPEIDDYDDTMAILDNLDLLVTVDTSVGHLAGAMGRPAWLMLARVPDWRWLLDREDTPWYPSHRLFRQTEDCSWVELVERLAQAVPPFMNSVKAASSDSMDGLSA
jgi:Tetratricopeptide repeat